MRSSKDTRRDTRGHQENSTIQQSRRDIVDFERFYREHEYQQRKLNELRDKRQDNFKRYQNAQDRFEYYDSYISKLLPKSIREYGELLEYYDKQHNELAGISEEEVRKQYSRVHDLTIAISKILTMTEELSESIEAKISEVPNCVRTYVQSRDWIIILISNLEEGQDTATNDIRAANNPGDKLAIANGFKDSIQSHLDYSFPALLALKETMERHKDIPPRVPPHRIEMLKNCIENLHKWPQLIEISINNNTFHFPDTTQLCDTFRTEMGLANIKLVRNSPTKELLTGRFW